MNLYEINHQIQCVLDQVDPDTGDISNEALEQLEQLEMSLEQKALNTGKWLKSIDAESVAIAEEIKKLSLRKKTLDSRYDRVKEYLTNALGGKVFKDAQCALSWRKSEAVNIIDERLITDEEFWKVKREISKTAVKEGIQSGKITEGAEIVIRNNLVIK